MTTTKEKNPMPTATKEPNAVVRKRLPSRNTLDEIAFVETADQWSFVKSEHAELGKRLGSLRNRLVDMVEQFGEQDDDGHVWLNLPKLVGKLKGFKWESRKSRNLDEDAAEKLLTEKGLLKSCQTRIVVLDEAKIEQAYYAGKLDDDDWDVLFPVKETRALIAVEEK
jgi:hypothetical protein